MATKVVFVLAPSAVVGVVACATSSPAVVRLPSSAVA